jgi:hypothetical protein
VAHGHKSLIFRHGQQCGEVFLHTILGIALGQTAQSLCGDCPLPVVSSAQCFQQVIPHTVGPFDRLPGRFLKVLVGLVSPLMVFRVQVGKDGLGRFQLNTHLLVSVCAFKVIRTIRFRLSLTKR